MFQAFSTAHPNTISSSFRFFYELTNLVNATRVSYFTALFYKENKAVVITQKYKKKKV